jgi:NADH:ubiquinone oxidoreductase subunit 6 (subunit J)
VKAVEVLHPSFPVYVGVLVTALVVIGGLVATSPRVHGHLRRLGKCAVAGLIAATVLVVWADSKHHTQLAAEAAKPAGGHRLTVGYLLADAFTFTTLVVTVVVFTVVTLIARRRAAGAFGRAPARTARMGGPQ